MEVNFNEVCSLPCLTDLLNVSSFSMLPPLLQLQRNSESKSCVLLPLLCKSSLTFFPLLPLSPSFSFSHCFSIFCPFPYCPMTALSVLLFAIVGSASLQTLSLQAAQPEPEWCSLQKHSFLDMPPPPYCTLSPLSLLLPTLPFQS